jgi:DNA primase
VEVRDEQALLAAFQDQVWEDEPAAYLAGRGITHSTITRFGLGYTGDWGRTETLDLRRSLVFPYEDGLGRVRKLRFRPLRPDYGGPKYLDRPGADPHLFAVRSVDHPVVHIAEGEMDTLSIWQVGFRAVGMPGAAMFSEHWKYLFRPPHVEKVVLVLDPDKSGKLNAIRVYKFLKDVVEQVHTVSLPRGHDVNDVLRKYGADTLREAIDV